MNKVKTLLIGHGYLGKWHAQKALDLEQCDLVAICESDKSRHSELSELYPDLKIVSEYTEITNEFDAALVVTPTALHFDIVKNLIELGKHVFCEKPLCRTYSETIELRKLSEQYTDTIIQVGHSERFHSLWNETGLVESIRNQKFQIEINRYAPFKGRATDVNVVVDLMIHDLDLITFLTGKWPTHISANGFKVLSPHIDTCSATLYYEDGSIAHIQNGRCHHVERRELLCAINQQHYIFDLSSSTCSVVKSDGQLIRSEYPKRDHLLEEQKSFYDSIINQKAAIVGLQDGIRAVYLIEKVLEAVEKRKIVEVERID